MAAETPIAGNTRMSIDTRAIRSEAHVEIGLLIQHDADLLVERWCGRAIAEEPNASRVHEEVLRDQLPDFLRVMGESLAQGGDPRRHDESAIEHGGQRWDSGWSLTALVRDYQLLQLVILEHLEETVERPLTCREAMAVGVSINDAIAASINRYVTNRDEHIRRIADERAAALEDASRRKDEFIAMLAHELRNPLAPIVNSVELLQVHLAAAGPDILQTLEIISRQSRFMTCLVDDLLDLARIAQGRFELRKEPLNFGTVLDEALQASDPLIKEREHRLNVAMPAEPLYLEADPARLTQIVVNLLNNAAKYTERGGEISVSVRRENDEAVIRVRDNGVGIPPEMLSRVFDMFVQAQGSNNHSQGGLGIGLTLVKRLVELHDGTIACRSAGLGKGSEFVVCLPAYPAGRAIHGAGLSHDAPSAAPCHILIIEDQSDARLVLAKLLEFLGHRVDSAGDGAHGIQLALANRPQVALVDIGLPDISGYEVAKRLRAELGDRIFLVALTGYAMENDLHEALDAGFDAHLVKPADLTELGRLLACAQSR
jgi:signal transduction histidine kinase